MDCEICNKSFKTSYYVNRHKKQVHKIESQPLKRGRPAGTGFTCASCKWTSGSKILLQQHCIQNHSIQQRKKQMLLHCPMDGCTEKLPFRLNLAKHVLHSHSNDLDEDLHEQYEIKEMQFSNMSEFEEWKLKEKQTTMSKYILICKSKRNSETIRITYGCHRSGTLKRRGKGIRHFKMQGSCKIGKICLAVISVFCSQVSGAVNIKYCKLHIGHGQDIAHLTLTKREREQIAGQLSQNIPLDIILKNVRESLSTNNISRMHLLQNHDLNNIMRDFNLDSDKCHENDAESVTEWIKKLKAKDDTTVRYAKFQGCVVDQFLSLSENDFVLVLMTDIQREMLFEFGQNIICLDSTHGTNAYNFQLTTILVLDEYNEGFPVAFCYSNRTDHITLKCFFSSIKNSLNEKLSVKILMTDDADSFYNAWSEVMGPPENKLLCSWHVDRAWRKNIASKIQGPQEFKVSVYKHLRLLLQCADADEFMTKMENFLVACKSDENTIHFGHYFYKEYVSRTREWAYCYRLGMHINSNMHLEAFHRVLKQVVMKGFKVRRMDKSINALMTFVKNKIFDRLLKLNKGKLTKAIQNIRKKHKDSLTLSVGDITEQSLNSWNIQSTNKQETYIVKKENSFNHTKPCALVCSDCNICVHTYSCTCLDYSLHLIICKHIHLLMRYLGGHVGSDNLQTEGFSTPVSNETIMETLKSTSVSVDCKIKEINDMMDQMKAKLLKKNNNSLVNYVHSNLSKMLGVIESNTGTENKFLTPMEKFPGNKKFEQQTRFFSTKKLRQNSQQNYSVPNNSERNRLSDDLLGKNLCIITENEHCYSKKSLP